MTRHFQPYMGRSVSTGCFSILQKEFYTIKMDIEGGEYNALLGAAQTIRMQQPALAISVYHEFNDFFQIPGLIRDYGVEYKYFLRHYAWNSSETILYAI